MPKVLILPNGYIVYFHSDESHPKEPVHVHIGKSLRDDAAKVWVCVDGACELEHNDGHIPKHELRKIMKAISVFYKEVGEQWEDFFEIKAEYKKVSNNIKDKLVVQANRIPYKDKKIKVASLRPKPGGPAGGNSGTSGGRDGE